MFRSTLSNKEMAESEERETTRTDLTDDETLSTTEGQVNQSKYKVFELTDYQLSSK